MLMKKPCTLVEEIYVGITTAGARRLKTRLTTPLKACAEWQGTTSDVLTWPTAPGESNRQMVAVKSVVSKNAGNSSGQ